MRKNRLAATTAFGLAVALVLPALAAPAAKKTTRKTTKKVAATVTTAAPVTAAPPTTAASPPAAAPAALAPFKSPVKVLVITAVGTNSSNFPDMLAGAQVAGKAINKAGGVRGTTMQVDFCNDKVDATEALNCARKATSDGYVGVITLGRFTAGYASVFEQSGVSVFDGTGNDAARMNNPQYVFTNSPLSSYTSAGWGAVKDGGRKIAVARTDVDAATPLGDQFKAGVKAAGGEIVGNDIRIPPTATNLSAQAAQIRASGADTVCVVGADNLLILLLQAMDSLGVQAKVCIGEGSLRVSTLQKNIALYDGMIIGSGADPLYSLDSNPTLDRFRREILAAGEEPNDTATGSGYGGWVQVYAFAEAAKLAKENTPKSVAESFNANTFAAIPGVDSWTPGTKGAAGMTRISRAAYVVTKIVKGRQAVIARGDLNKLPKVA